MVNKSSKWVPIFREFVRDLRITSKEISSEDDRGVPLNLWQSQSRVLDFIGGGLDDGIRQFFILKSRQLGITTISLAIDVFWLAFNKNLFAALVTDTEKNKDVNRNIIRKYIESTPPGYFGSDFIIDKDNRNFMQFSNGSRLDLLVAGTKKKGVSWAEGAGYTMAHLTEVAKYGDPDAVESFMESLPNQNPNRLLICESTGQGYNLWRDMYVNALQDTYTKRAIFVGFWASDVNRIERSDPRFIRYGLATPSGAERERVAAVANLYGWKITPEQLAWIRWREDNVNDPEGIFSQNQPWVAEDAFVMSGYSFFQTRMIAKDIKTLIDAPPGVGVEEGGFGYTPYYYELDAGFFNMKLRMVEDDDTEIELRIWEEPVKGAKYVIGFDPAWGRNEHSDRHCVSVWRCFGDKLVQVAEYATADVEVKCSAWVLAHLAGAYDDVIVNIDLNGPGRVIMLEWDHLKDLMNASMNESLVRSRQWEEALHNARWYLYNRPDSMGKGFAANFESTSRTKTELMHGMRGAYMTQELVIRSLNLLKEMRIVIADGDQIGAPESSKGDIKDDRVYATALAHRAWVNWRRPELLNAGVIYQTVMDQERGKSGPAAMILNNVVQKFLMNQEQRRLMEEVNPPRHWRTDLGL